MQRVFAIALILVLMPACGEDAEDADTGGGATVDVVASVIALEGPAGPVVEARMAVLENGVFAEEAVDPMLTIGGTEIPLTAQRVRLGDGSTTTWYEASSQSQAALQYEEGVSAQFDFALSSTRTRYATNVRLPSQATQLDAATEPGVGKDVDMVASGSFDGALLLVDRLDTGEQTYASFPFRPELVGDASELTEASTLRSIDAGVVTVPAAAFSRRGTHEVVFIGLSLSEGGDAVSDRSVTFAGTARATTLDIN